jgi:hypothetical protein
MARCASVSVTATDHSIFSPRRQGPKRFGRSLSAMVLQSPQNRGAIAYREVENGPSGPTSPCHHRLDAVRAHRLELAGDHRAAIEHYRAAAGRTTSLPERNCLATKAVLLAAEHE